MKGDYGKKPTPEQVAAGIRLAKCVDCDEWGVSDPTLPMFQEGQKDCGYDYFYCGCRGWD
jgi:hypothetical protein